jgi:hypothetical protein
MLFQIAVLQDDKKALERHLKLKEAALVEAGNILRSALERALIVEDVQNQNIELKKQMEIYHVSTLADLYVCAFATLWN